MSANAGHAYRSAPSTGITRVLSSVRSHSRDLRALPASKLRLSESKAAQVGRNA
jgi:hypothetical protein